MWLHQTGEKEFDGIVYLCVRTGNTLSPMGSRGMIVKFIRYMMGGTLTRTDMTGKNFEEILKACQSEIVRQHPRMNKITERAYVDQWYQLAEKLPCSQQVNTKKLWVQQQDVFQQRLPMRPFSPETIIDLRLRQTYRKKKLCSADV